jgi:hypothetical protein
MEKKQLEALLLTYNLKSTVNFPTRCQKNSTTAVDNIFINIDRKNDYNICPIINGLSDHDAQLITLNEISLKPPTKQIMEIRKFYKNSINDFLNKLSFETWDITFLSEDVNIMFNAFQDPYLKIFYSSFSIKKIQTATKKNDWITLGIRTLCKHKRELYIACKNKPNLRNFIKNIVKLYLLLFKKLKDSNMVVKSKNLTLKIKLYGIE